MTEMAPPEPGERCGLCHRRLNKKRTEESPPTRRVQFTLPSDRAEALEEAIETLQEYVGADPYSYPKGSVMEASVLLAIQQREEVKAHFNGD